MSLANHSLLERVLANRRDDDARRVFADWLSSHGDPRGELIHLQVDRAQGRGDPAKLERELLLLDEHREVWSRPLDSVASNVVFERGFPACVELDLDRSAALLPCLAESLAWATVEHLFVREASSPMPASVLAPLLDAPHMRELTQLAAPLDMLLALAADRLRSWQAVTVLSWKWSLNAVLELCGHLPSVAQVGVIVSYADEIKQLCALAPLVGRVGGLQILWYDNGHAPSGFSRFFELVAASAFESLHWVDTSLNVELLMRRGAAGDRWSLAGDVYAIDGEINSQIAAVCDDVTLYSDANVGADDYHSLRELFEGVGATVRIEMATRTRWLPLP